MGYQIVPLGIQAALGWATVYMQNNTTATIHRRPALITPNSLLCDRNKENARSQTNKWLLIRKQNFETKE